MPPEPGEPPKSSPGRGPHPSPCPLSPIPSSPQPGQPPAAAAASPRPHHRPARSEMPFHFPDADGPDEIGSEVMDKIVGVARDRAAEMSFSLPCSTKHRHTASFDGVAMSCGGPGGQQDGGGARGLFADVLEAMEALSSE
ncbi:hypothetical protein ZWY2020_015615 [Hordeum vulgare]|nr:hypothetical protein ZWY2020_015615 [Hordeum vulgare]